MHRDRHSEGFREASHDFPPKQDPQYLLPKKKIGLRRPLCLGRHTIENKF